MMYNFFFNPKSIKNAKNLLIILIFIFSMVAIISPVVFETKNNPTNLMSTDKPIQPILPDQKGDQLSDSKTSVEDNFARNLDNPLTEWIKSGIPPDYSVYRRTINDEVVISVFAGPNTQIKKIDQYMKIDSYVDLGYFGHLVFGSVDSAKNLKTMVEHHPSLMVNADPFINSIAPQGELVDYKNPLYEYSNPDQFVSLNEMSVNQAHNMDCGGNFCNGTGITIAIVDGGTDFGNSDLEPALALDSDKLPTSFDTESWSLIATPLIIGVDVPISPDNSTLYFQNLPVEIYNKLQINDPGDLEDNNRPELNTSRGWIYWHQNKHFMAPQDWKIDPSWINQPNQAPPRFGVGVQHWTEVFTEDNLYGFIYALLLDINADQQYDSAIIDMETSAWATYLNYVERGGATTPITQIFPDFDFTNDKVVSWISNPNNTGANFTFAKDWDNDSVNDFSFGSMANAYNRYGFLNIDQDTYGKIVRGVDPDGAGFVTFYPFGPGFSAHGTWTASAAGSRGIVNYSLFTNRTNSVNYPYGNLSTRVLPGIAPGAQIMSVTFGASPQDELLGWFWAAGFDLVSNFDQTTAEMRGSQWKWSGKVRANITSNSWGIGGLYWSGLWGNDFLSDLLSLPNLGGGETFYRRIEDAWTSSVLSGSSTETNIDEVNFFEQIQPFTDISNQNSLYVGGNNPFQGLRFNLTNPVSGAYTVVPEYFTGVEWKSVTITENIQWNSEGLSQLSFFIPGDWILTNFTENGDKFFWLRLTATVNSQVIIEGIEFEFLNPYYGFPGILMVTSAGNDFYYQSTGNGFGSLTLKVGASSSAHGLANQYGPNWDQTNHQVAYFSSSGPKSTGVPTVDILAPGYYIYSAAPLSSLLFGETIGPGDITSFGGNGTYAFVRWAGTSAAAPGAAGVAALAYQAYMTTNSGEFVNPITIKQILKNTATDLNFPTNIQGTGLLNASAAVEFIQNPDLSPYFLLGSNITFEEQLTLSSWLNTIGQYYMFFAYTPRDEYADLIDFPVTIESILEYQHMDVDLSTKTLTKGDIITTQVSVEHNSSAVQLSATQPQILGNPTETFLIDSNDHFKGMTGDYQVNISLASFDVWNADFIEISVSNIADFDNVSFFVWEDFDNDGYLEMANFTAPESNGAGELGRVQYETTREGRSHGMLKIGSPSKFNSSSMIPMLVLRGDLNKVDVYSPNWAAGKLITIAIKAYSLNGGWSSAISSTPWKSENGKNIWNITIDTTNLHAGFHLGSLKFTDLVTGHVQLMPISIKVSHGQIDQSDPTTNPNATPSFIGNYTIQRSGEPFDIGFRYGSMIWVPFTVDESKVSEENVLAIKVTQQSQGDANFGYVLHYDSTPYAFDAHWFQIFTSENITGQVDGKNVNWHYFQWGDVGFGSEAFISRFGYIRYGLPPNPTILQYKLGLFATKMASELNVSVEMYWLPTMPRLQASPQSTFPIGNYCQTVFEGLCYYYASVLYGPGAEFSVVASCESCDPNLPDPHALFGKVEAFSELDYGSFIYGYDPGISIDWWYKLNVQKGDLVEFIVNPFEPVTDFNVWLYKPSTIERLNQTLLEKLPVNDSSIIFLSDSLLDYATTSFTELGSFIADETGEYWFGIDNFFGAETDWIVFTQISRGPVEESQFDILTINTLTEEGYGLDVEATYDPFTNSYDKSTHLVFGASTPTGLDHNLNSLEINFDNIVAPIVELGELSKSLNSTVIYKDVGNITFDWIARDVTGDLVTFYLLFSGPNIDDLYAAGTNTDSFIWDFTDNPDEFTDGWWNIYIWADDSVDPDNILNGVNYGGWGVPALLTVFLLSEDFKSNQTTTIVRGPDLLEIFGFTSIGMVGGILVSAVSAGVYLRRVKLKEKFNDQRDKFRNFTDDLKFKWQNRKNK